MRRLFLAFSFLLFLSPPVWAFEAECLVAREKIKTCEVSFSEEALQIAFSKENEKLNRVVPGDKILQIKEGESARRETMKTFMMGPLMFFSLFGKNRAVGEVFGIEYLNQNEKPSTLFIRLKKKEGIVFGTSLRKLQGP